MHVNKECLVKLTLISEYYVYSIIVFKVHVDFECKAELSFASPYKHVDAVPVSLALILTHETKFIL